MSSKIDFNLIPFFLAIYEEGSISKAASKLGVTQPAVSKKLKSLRDRYNDVLFIRHHYGVYPSTKATEIYSTLAAANELCMSTLEHTSGFNPAFSKRHFSIACANHFSHQLAPYLLTQIRERAPFISIDVSPLHDEEYDMSLRTKCYDFVVDTPSNRTHSLVYKQIGQREMVVVCSQKHPRLLGSTLLQKDYFREAHVVLWQHSAGSNKVFSREALYSLPNVFDMLKTVEKTDLVCLMDLAIAQFFKQLLNIKLLPFPFEQTKSDLCLIYHPNRRTDVGHKWMRKLIMSQLS